MSAAKYAAASTQPTEHAGSDAAVWAATAPQTSVITRGIAVAVDCHCRMRVFRDGGLLYRMRVQQCASDEFGVRLCCLTRVDALGVVS